ncbi:MAG: helix-turn-helix transcriptional regulator [Halarcobacter sp.]
MSQKSSLYRTIEILKDLNAGKKLCISNLATAYEVSDRTIRRDFELIKEIFGDFVSKEGECYQAYKKVLLEDVLNARDLMTLANIVNLFGITQKESLISDKTKALIKQSMSVYDFKSRPFESIKKIEVIKKLEHAIKFNKEVKIKYKSERAVTQTNFRPYKILFLNENFYLVGENASKSQFEFRRISMIEEVTDTKKTFYAHSDIQKFIKKIQTPWAVFGKDNILVKLRVSKKVSRFFIFKKYLPSQEVVHTFDNGDIEVHYNVSSLNELAELVIKWLPNINIISPQSFKKMLKRKLKQKLLSLNN